MARFEKIARNKNLPSRQESRNGPALDRVTRPESRALSRRLTAPPADRLPLSAQKKESGKSLSPIRRKHLKTRVERRAGLFQVQRKIQAKNLKEFVQEQHDLQTDVAQQPGQYAGRLVTVGFEHEFGTFVDEKLHGVSHLRIGTSQQRMPYKNLPFYLETDAANEIELVDPPFLIETSEPGKPVPHPVDLDIASRLLEGALYSIILNFPSLKDFVSAFQQISGIDFTVPPTKVQAENLSDKTAANFTQQSAPIPSAELLSLRLGPGQKYGGRISTQINFATNAATYSKMQEMNPLPLGIDFAPMAFVNNFSEKIKGGLKNRSRALDIFYQEFHRQLKGQGVRFLAEHIRELQQKEYKGGARIRDSAHNEQEFFRLAGGLTSKIKDLNRTWLKDSLMSFGSGILNAEEWKAALKYTLYAQNKLKEEQIKKNDPHYKYKNATRKYIRSMLKEMRKQIIEARASNTFYDPQSRPGFMEHDDKLLGVRQDTYVRPQDAQMPGIWNDRLHVIEARSDSLGAITRLDSENERGGQIAKDNRQGAPSDNYNMLMKGYFMRHEQHYLDPITGEKKPLFGSNYPMHYSGKLKMFFVPNMNLFYDPDKQEYFDQAAGAYYKPHRNLEQAYYFLGNTKFPFDSKQQMFKFSDDRFFDRRRGAWFKPSDGTYTFARIESFKNPSRQIDFNPKSTSQV